MDSDDNGNGNADDADQESSSSSSAAATLSSEELNELKLKFFTECFVREYYLQNGESKVRTKCNLCSEPRVFNGFNKSTLWRHLKSFHEDSYAKLTPSRLTRKRRCLVFKDHGEILINESRKDLVQLIASGRPLSLIYDEPMKNMLSVIEAYASGETVKAYLSRRGAIATPTTQPKRKKGQENSSAAQSNTKPQMKPNVFTKNRLLKDITDMVGKVKEAISAEIKETGSFVSVMTDIASRHGISTLGISVQYKRKGDWKTINRTIGMVRLSSSHTGAYICDQLNRTFHEYGIDVKQLYAITTDCGANILKAGRDLNSLFLNDEAIEVEDDKDGENGSENEFLLLTAMAQTSTAVDSHSDDEHERAAESNEYEAEEQDLGLLRDFSNIFTRSNSDVNMIKSLLCAAHSLQICVEKAIKKFEKDSKLISKCRLIVTKLRTQNFRYLLRWTQRSDSRLRNALEQ